MPKFKPGDYANIATRNGEVTVKINSEEMNGHYFVALHDADGVLSGRTETVHASRLRVLKGPFFDIRGQVLTVSSSHPGEVGEIVGTGKSKSGKLFFKVQFGDGAFEWFNEDQVFLDDETKQKHDEAAKDNQFFR